MSEAHASDFKNLLPRRGGTIFIIGLLGGFLATLAISLLVLIAATAPHTLRRIPMNDMTNGVPLASSADASGQTVASANGCLACHSTDGSSSVGPTWFEVFGSERLLASGETVTVDSAYLQLSIVDPRAQLAAGYPEAVMPAGYATSLTASEIDALVEYIATLGG